MIRRGKLAFLPERDSRVKIMNERITITEKHFGELCSVIAAYTRKLGRFRDKHDELAKALQLFSQEEIVNRTLGFGIESFSKAITILADYMDIEVHRIELKIVSELAQYGTICRNTREVLRTAVSARDKEVHRQKQLIEIKTKFAGNTSATDSELLKAKLEVNKSNKEIDEIIDNFEKTKLKDMKGLLLDFIAIQLKQYAKAIEVLSAAYYDMSAIDEKSDFQDFKKLVKNKPKYQHIFNVRSQSVDSLATSKLSGAGKPRRERLSLSTKDLTTTVTEEDEEEDEEQSEAAEENTEESTEKSNEDSLQTDGEESDSHTDDIKPAPRSHVRYRLQN